MDAPLASEHMPSARLGTPFIRTSSYYCELLTLGGTLVGLAPPSAGVSPHVGARTRGNATIYVAQLCRLMIAGDAPKKAADKEPLFPGASELAPVRCDSTSSQL